MGITAGVTAAASVIGAGTSLGGTFMGMGASKNANQAYGNIAAEEQQAEGVRQQAMETSARRQQLEIVRNGQRARAFATNAAVNQGAQFGSGLSGGYGQISGATGFNLQGVTDNLQTGRQLFGIDSQISANRIAANQARGQEMTAMGVQSIGRQIGSMGPTMGRLAGGFGGFGGFGAGASNPNTSYGAYGYNNPTTYGGLY